MTKHLAAVKHILRYVSGKKDFGCCYRRSDDPEPKLVGYCDSDMGGDVDDRKSITGIAFYLGQSLITWGF